jgi:hypothetical protein
VIVQSSRDGEVQGFPNDKRDKSPHYKYRIKLQTGKSFPVKKYFSFYTSTDDYIHGRTRISHKELLDVFRCILEDGIAGDMECDQFFSEFGYTDCTGIKVWQECQKTRDKIRDLGFSIEGLYNMVNELNEIEEKEG